MELSGFPNEDNIPPAENPEVPPDVRASLREGVAIAISEQRIAETTNVLVRTPWLMQRVVDRAMAFVEETGISLEGFETSVSEVIAEALRELLPEEPQEDSGTSGDREPRKPILPTLIGGVAMALPSGQPETA